VGCLLQGENLLIRELLDEVNPEVVIPTSAWRRIVEHAKRLANNTEKEECAQ